jgi:hypothetical protein
MRKPSLAKTALALAMFIGLFHMAQIARAQDQTVKAINAQRLAKVVPGISKARVKELLGAPWRTVQYNDLDEIENEFWEYRGKDAQGPYRIHIEFDRKGVVLIVGKVPEGVPGTQGTPAKS